MISSVLQKSNENLINMDCCHGKTSAECDCYECLRKGFYETFDTYNECKKKLSYYVLNYGLSYASEIYHYLNVSKFIKPLFDKETLIVKSLGCGASLDYYAFKKYIADQLLNCRIKYIGYELSKDWDCVRITHDDLIIYYADLTKSIDLSHADIVVIGKIFSTLFKHGKSQEFINSLSHAITYSLNKNSIIVFNDVNHKDMGRDYFQREISTLLPEHHCFYFNGYTGNNWEKITNTQNVFQIPQGLKFSPLPNIGDTVVFEYRKQA